MRTPRYLPKVRNGAVAKRQARSKNPATSKAFSVGAGVPRPRRNSRRFSNRAGGPRRIEGRGAKVMWLMILIGVSLAAGFVFALRSQINAYRIAQAEEQLKMKLDEYASRQKFLELDQRRALSAGEIERAGRRNGLDQLKLDGEPVRRNASVQRLVAPGPTPRAGHIERPGGRPEADGRSGLRSVKRPVKSGSKAKLVVVKAVKTGKNAKVVKVVKSNAAKPSGAANKARANVVKTRKRRIKD